MNAKTPSIGSLFAGIGGFDLGFEQAGFSTAWQVEIDPTCREVLADRFPHAKQFADVRTVLPELWRVDAIIGGFPCQDVSIAGKRRGLAGKRTGLFFDALNIVNTLQPRWLVLENVTGLLNSNNGKDFQTVIQSLAECGYVGYWRVLNAAYFGVPTARRRVFLVAGLGEYPPIEFMADCGAMGGLPEPLEENGQNPTVLCCAALGQAALIVAPRILSVSPTHGIRWLSGKERLTMMGFAWDWMRPTLQRLRLPEMPSVRKSQNGSQKNS